MGTIIGAAIIVIAAEIAIRAFSAALRGERL